MKIISIGDTKLPSVSESMRQNMEEEEEINQDSKSATGTVDLTKQRLMLVEPINNNIDSLVAQTVKNLPARWKTWV